MVDSLDEIISRSGDSKLLDCSYAFGILSFDLSVDELDCVVRFRLSTPAVASSGKGGNSVWNVGRLELLRLEENLDLENGIYIPAADFGRMMKQRRAGLHLAYGLRNSEAKVLLRVVGSGVLLACPVEDPDEIQWEVID